MPSSLSKSLITHSPLSHMELEASNKVISEKQGIVAILGPSDCERSKAASLRRTLSADMSSKKWLAHNGFSPMKKIASSEQLSFWGSTIEEEDQKQMMKKAEGEKQPLGQLDIWSSIVCQKANDEAEKSAGPYVHPLVKKQSSSLNEKSLEVCTESLGSETGSEGFSSYPSSETGDVESQEKDSQEEGAEVQQEGEEKVVEDVAPLPFHGDEFQVVKYKSAASKKLPAIRSFPPPLRSLSGCDGASVRMRTHRDNGRLVLKAVSVPSPNNFRAQRQDGRLVLTFVAPSQTSCEEAAIEEEEENFVGYFEENESSDKSDDEDEEDEESDEAEKENRKSIETEIVREEAPKVLLTTSRVTNVHRLALMMNRPIGFANNRNPGWANYKFNEVVKYGGHDDEEEEEMVDVVAEATTLAKSLPPRPGRVARLIPKPPKATAATPTAASTFNAYEYYWRAKPTATTSQSLKSSSFMATTTTTTNKNQVANYEQQQLLLLRGNKGDQWAPLSKGCKEPRRSLLFWEPYCIATS